MFTVSPEKTHHPTNPILGCIRRQRAGIVPLTPRQPDVWELMCRDIKPTPRPPKPIPAYVLDENGALIPNQALKTLRQYNPFLTTEKLAQALYHDGHAALAEYVSQYRKTLDQMRLEDRADLLLKVLKSTGEWMSRSEIAGWLSKKSFTGFDMAAMDLLLNGKLAWVCKTPVKGQIGFMFEYRAALLEEDQPDFLAA